MKNRAKWMIVPALVLSIGACKKKEEVKAPGAPVAAAGDHTAAGTPAVPAEPSAPKVPVLSAEERAAKLGFVKYLPKDTESVISFHHGSETAAKLKATKIWKLVENEMNGEDPDGMDMNGEMPVKPAEEMAEAPASETPAAETTPPATDAAAEAALKEQPAAEEGFGPAALLGTEVTVALGKTTGEQLGNLLHVSQRSNYFQMRNLAKAFVEAAKTGDSSAFEEKLGEGLNESLVKDLINDPESGIGSIEKANMPPIYIAFRVKEAQRDVAAQQLSSVLAFLGMMGDVVSPVEAEKSGFKFTGYKISGAKISEMAAQGRAQMDAELGQENVTRLLAAIAQKDIVAVSGLVGDYAVVFLGDSTDDLVLAATPADSLVATDALAFTDGYATKELSVLGYGEKGSLETLVKSSQGISSIAKGVRDGLAGSEGLGDTRDIEALLQVVTEREAALLKLSSTEALGVIGYMEDGFKMEIYGGTDNGYADWKTPNRLAHLGKSPDTVLFANFTSEAAYDEAAKSYFESLLETAYAITLKVSEVPSTEGDMAQFKQMANVFETQFRGDVVSFWNTYSGDFASGLGKEGAFVLDLKGSVPPLPGLPQAFVDKGKFPRLTIVSPVVDRAKLGVSWDKMNATTTSILGKVSGLTGQDIPMQKPISSEKNGFTTWFFAVPFFNDDFLPSVTVGDKWFAASTSKNQALDLLGQAAAGGETSTGLTFTVNFKALQDYSRETLKVVDENSAAIFGTESDAAAEYAANKEKIRKAIDTLDDMDSFSAHARREGGVLRSSLHFKTR